MNTILNTIRIPTLRGVCTRGAAAASIMVCAACQPDGIARVNNTGAFFLSVTGETSEYIVRAEQLDSGAISIADNEAQLEMSGYTWIFGGSPTAAVGLVYRQGSPGIGLGYVLDASGKLRNEGQFQISSRFTSYGFVGKYAVTSVGGAALADSLGNALADADGTARSDGAVFNFIDTENGFALQEKTIATRNIAGNGEQATFCGIVDMGNGEFLAGLVLSQPRAPDASGGASTGRVSYPDSVWAALMDARLNVKRIYRDHRISYSAGRYRSQYYSQMGRADNGSVYVFSGSYEADASLPAGALRINGGDTSFDASYYYNIEEKTEGIRFRRVWHIAQSYFLLEMYNERTISSATPATQYGIVEMEGRTFAWVSGIPAPDRIVNTGLPVSYGGRVYLPITEQNADPAIYVIDPASASAAKGISITGASAINAAGYLGR